MLGWLLQGAGVRQWWRDREDLFSDAFRDVIESLIREGEAPG